MTVPNQPNSIKIRIAAPASMTSILLPCKKLAKPNSIVNKPIEPTMGQ